LLTNLGRLPGVFTTGKSKIPGGEYTGESRLPGNEYTGESRLPGGEYTGESITNSNNSLNIRKNSKSFLGVSIGTRRRCLMKKTRVKKSRDTVPLNSPLEAHRFIKTRVLSVEMSLGQNIWVGLSMGVQWDGLNIRAPQFPYM
jgi:hypothetical protein